LAAVILVPLEVYALTGALAQSFGAVIEATPGHLHLLLIALASDEANLGTTAQRLRSKRQGQHAKQGRLFHGFTSPAGGLGCGAGGTFDSVEVPPWAPACSRVTWNSTRRFNV
jgi:hypothetical protein